MTASPRFGLPSRRRLHGSGAFHRVRSRGERRTCGCLIANWLQQPACEPSTLGVVTSRRIGGAVQRSRARRLLREAFRLQQHHLRQGLILVLVARPSIAGKSLTTVVRDLRRCLRHSAVWVESQPTQPPLPPCAP
ncbi:MAG: ribonuclease P protein component [Verrucomicrobiae bacterium]|nr:ribonuclease P protein component [Verrucomicrobiae bacterium]